MARIPPLAQLQFDEQIARYGRTNKSSVMGLRGGNRLYHCVASRWGLVGRTKSWAIELASHGPGSQFILDAGLLTR